jgi:hypothetical protein
MADDDCSARTGSGMSRQCGNICGKSTVSWRCSCAACMLRQGSLVAGPRLQQCDTAMVHCKTVTSSSLMDRL